MAISIAPQTKKSPGCFTSDRTASSGFSSWLYSISMYRNALSATPARVVLLAARERGYRSLMKLNSRAFQETPINQEPKLTRFNAQIHRDFTIPECLQCGSSILRHPIPPR